MKIFNLSEIGTLLDKGVPVHLGIGIYDGFHRGHAEIFSRAKIAAQADGGICGALTFAPHPEVFFKGAGTLKLIYPLSVRLQLFESAGLDFAICEPFTQEFASIRAEEFIKFLKSKIPSLKSIYVGENFRFGAKRGGNVDVLSELGKNFNVSVKAIAPVLFKNEKISSTRIREALSKGEISDANAMLSRSYFCAGTVIGGRQLGRTIGFPTLNISWEPELLPRFGVYSVSLEFPKTKQFFRGVANFGVRPTVERESVPAPLLEVNILNADGSAELPTKGDYVSVDWLRFIRPEQKFASLDALREQLVADKLNAEIF